jgi:site-specific DNA recombinase
MKAILPHGSALPAPDCVGYIRVSKEDQAAERKTSLSDQRKAIEELANRNKLSLRPEFIFEDAGFSGATAVDRPGFMRLVEYCKQHPRPPKQRGYVLVLNDSRWGRFKNPDDATAWRAHFEDQGWHVKFAEADDTEDPIARSVLRALGSSQASLYRESIRATAKRGARGAAAKGLWQTKAPLGYRRLARDSATGKTRVLESGQRKADNEDVVLTPGPEQEIVRWIFSRFASGEVSLGSLAKELDARFPSRAWSRQTVRSLLKNPAYCGDVVWCRRPHDKDERREHWVRPRSEWVGKKDAHPALVTRQLFEAVQQRIAVNKKRTRATVGGYPLSGLLRCAECDKRYIGGGGPVGTSDEPDRYRYYKDAGGDGRAPVCSNPLGTLQKRWIEPRVIDAVAQVLNQRKMQNLIAEELDRQLAVAGHDHLGNRQNLERERKRLMAEKDRLVQAIARGVLTEDEAKAQIETSRDAIGRITAEVEGLRFRERAAGGLREERNRLLALACNFKRATKKASGPELRELLRPWIADGVVDKNKRQVSVSIRKIPLSGVLLHLSDTAGRGSR